VKLPIALLTATALAACAGDDTSVAPPVAAAAADVATELSLRDAFAGDFLIGTALNVTQIDGADQEFPRFVLHHFNAVTGENQMKWERIHPEEGKYAWEPADALAAFANENDLHLTGHTLIWHQQTPDWVFRDGDGNTATRELLLERMESHITAVVSRYKGRVDTWDVVNEGIDEDGSLRDNVWRQIIGDDYIEKAFEFAHAADPDAQLIYNDYNMFKPERRAGTIRLVESLRRKGIPIHGVGMQGHFRVDYPETLGEVENSIVAFGEMGLDVAITELDVSVLPWPGEKRGGADIMDRHEFEASMNPYVDGLTAEAERAVNARWLELFNIFTTHSDTVSRVTFWGVNDGVSWRNNWPMQGRTDYPLLIDRGNQPKAVWSEIINATGSHVD
jgi:endo-1,4-beta-xylanase